MIQIFHVESPFPTGNNEETLTKLGDALRRLQVVHPALRGARLEESSGLLHMYLRTAGMDRWKTMRAARTIASAMLRHIGVPAADATIVLESTERSSRTLTLDEGRQMPQKRRGRRKQEDWSHITWQDPD